SRRARPMRRIRSRLTKRKCSRVATRTNGHSELRPSRKRKQESTCERIACAERVGSIDRLDLYAREDAVRDGERPLAAELHADDAVACGECRRRLFGLEPGNRARLGDVREQHVCPRRRIDEATGAERLDE